MAILDSHPPGHGVLYPCVCVYVCVHPNVNVSPLIYVRQLSEFARDPVEERSTTL